MSFIEDIKEIHETYTDLDYCVRPLALVGCFFICLAYINIYPVKKIETLLKIR